MLAAAFFAATPAQTFSQAPQKPHPAAKPLDPRLQQVLQLWAQKTKVIRKLEGNHTRVTYDEVFKVEKRARGLFYYESPDKGRIDVSVVKVEDSTKGRPGFTVQSDLPSRWICDGLRVTSLDDVRKVATILPIPKEGQGANIMDGPLPFLFGMPAEKAKKRYRFELLKITKDDVWLQVLPRTRTDAMNWKEAKVILMKDTFLPRAVQLLDPTGNRTTVYQFTGLQINKEESKFRQLIGIDNDPFKPNLKGYKTVMPEAPKARQASNPPRAPANAVRPAGNVVENKAGSQPTAPKQAKMPQLTNYHWKIVKQRFEAAGYTVKIFQGKPAPQDKLVYCVYAQHPAAGNALEKGQTVKITLYDRTVQQTSAAKPVQNN